MARDRKSDRVVGFVCGRYKGRWYAETWSVAFICVRPEYQNRGIGAKLINTVLALAKSKNAKFVFLSVKRNNQDALELYEKIGFKVTEEHPGILCMMARI